MRTNPNWATATGNLDLCFIPIVYRRFRGLNKPPSWWSEPKEFAAWKKRWAHTL